MCDVRYFCIFHSAGMQVTSKDTRRTGCDERCAEIGKLINLVRFQTKKDITACFEGDSKVVTCADALFRYNLFCITLFCVYSVA